MKKDVDLDKGKIALEDVTVEYVLGLSGVEKTLLADKVADEKFHWAEHMARAKEKGHRAPFWSSFESFYMNNRTTVWKTLTEKQQNWLRKGAQMLGASPVELFSGESTHVKAAKASLDPKAESLESLLEKARGIRKPAARANTPPKRKPKWSWTRG